MGDTMMIDTNTVRLLELVAGNGREASSMFGLFACKTPGGSRLLRRSLLQPSTKRQEIEARQVAVEAILGNEALFCELQRLLPTVGELDILAARLTAKPKMCGTQWCKVAIRTAVKLRQGLRALTLIADSLRVLPANAPALLTDAREQLSLATFPTLVEELDRVIDANAPPSLAGGSLAHAALLYTVRPGICALLDVARQTWNDALEQVHSLHRNCAISYPEMNVRLEFSEARGWYLSHKTHNIPAEFIRTVQKGNTDRQLSTTRELNTENFKLRQAEREILTQTLAMLGGLFEVLRPEAPSLYRVSHTLSTLDLLQAFVGYALALDVCVKPELSDDALSPIAIKAGRHPVLEQLMKKDSSAGTFEPVDFFVDSTCHFQTVTGENGGGKSTYLQTLAQLVILAQIGSFVPAERAMVRLVPRLFTRIGSSDSIEASASTFLVEMEEAARILRDVSPESLVMVDELGRGTAHVDGVALCWAICERLLELRAYTLFATHFFEVCRLQSLCGGCRNMHLQITEGTHGSKYTVRHISLEELLAKPQDRYGIRVAAKVLPQELICTARAMAAKVESRFRLQLPSRAGGGREDTVKTAQDLLALVGGSLTSSALRDILRMKQLDWLERCAGLAACGDPGSLSLNADNF